MFDSDDDDDIQYWGTYPSTHQWNVTNPPVPLVSNRVPGSSMLTSYASVSGDAPVATQGVPPALSARANPPSVLKSVAKPEQPVNGVVGNTLSLSLVCRSAFCAWPNHVGCGQAIHHKGVEAAPSSSPQVIGSPVSSVTQKNTEARSALPLTSASVNKPTVLDSGLKWSHQPILVSSKGASSSSSSHALTSSSTDAQVLSVPQGDDQSTTDRVPSRPIEPTREAIQPLVVGDSPTSFQNLQTDSTDDQSLHNVASVLRNCSSSDIRWKKSAPSHESGPIVLSCDMSSIFTHFCDYLGDRERGRSLQIGSIDSTVVYDGPLATAADLKLAALSVTFSQSQHDLFNEWINERLVEDHGARKKPSTVAASLSLVRHTASGLPPREPRNTEDPNKHIKWWTGRDPEPRCPSCDEYEGGSAVARTTHYLKWHYDLYYKDSSEVDDELWLSVRLGRKRRPGLGDLRACLICHFGSLHDGREELLAHFKKVHPEEFDDLQKKYQEMFSSKEVEDEFVRKILMNEEHDIKPVSGTPNKRRKKESAVPTNTVANKKESIMARCVREKLASDYADFGMDLGAGTWLTDSDARKFQEWMDYWESPEGKMKGMPPKANVHLEVISSKCEQRAINRASKQAASNVIKTERARAVREKLTRCYADCGMALPDGVWLRDEDAAKFEEWMEYWESDEGKAAGGPPKQGNS